ncbi:ABC transporter permease subunit [Ensifer psoraleae]|uniref:ABC transporter permease subunit n=1 Tax=Sinorhizobium psoraleae TaxID=520838 RepID=A0ABT4KNH1_9HYPH|nr:ABC transporter permease subunit [Sinorhizobium psoraleae]
MRSVPVGEIEAAKALGMSYGLRMRRIVLPAAFRIALPAFANEVVLMLKASSLASTITLMELTGTARKIVSQTFSPYEVFHFRRADLSHTHIRRGAPVSPPGTTRHASPTTRACQRRGSSVGREL